MRSSTWTIRMVRAAAFAAIIAGSGAEPVAAKIPYFTVEITPAAPIAGEPMLIVVRFWVDAGHTNAAPFDWEPTMDNLLVVRADSGRPEVPVTLQLREPGRFEATVTLQAGDWTIVAFPDRSGWATADVPEGYPDTISIVVGEPALHLWRVAVPFVVIALVMVAGAFAWISLLQAHRPVPGRDTQVG